MDSQNIQRYFETLPVHQLNTIPQKNLQTCKYTNDISKQLRLIPMWRSSSSSVKLSLKFYLTSKKDWNVVWYWQGEFAKQSKLLRLAIISFILLNLEKLDPGHFKGYAKNFCQKNLMKKKKEMKLKKLKKQNYMTFKIELDFF